MSIETRIVFFATLVFSIKFKKSVVSFSFSGRCAPSQPDMPFHFVTSYLFCNNLCVIMFSFCQCYPSNLWLRRYNIHKRIVSFRPLRSCYLFFLPYNNICKGSMAKCVRDNHF